MVTRRRLIEATLTGSAVAATMLNSGAFALGGTTKYSSRAIELVQRSTVIDMLGVLSINPIEGEKWLMGDGIPEHKLKEFSDSGINVMHVAYGMGGRESHAQALQFFAAYNGLITRYPDKFRRIISVRDFETINSSGKVGLLLGIQNADHFRNPDDVALFYGLGQRCTQLTYNSQNLIGSGSTDRVDGGVSDFGAAIIKKMNEVGMLVDVSHSGELTTLDAIDISTKPISFTHSNCRALNNHVRLKSDEAIKLLAKKGGVMGITGVRMFVRDKEPTTIEHMVNHIDHVVKLVGIDHVGIGSDADLTGYDALPKKLQKMVRAAYKKSYGFREKIDIDGFNHPQKMFDLTDALIRRGYTNEHIELILGGNFKRLLSEVWV